MATLMNDIKKILITKDALAERIAALGKQITRDLSDIQRVQRCTR